MSAQTIELKNQNSNLNKISFTNIRSNPIFYKIVQDSFKNILKPIYGDQKKAVDKIKEGLDRTCEIMLNYENPIGIIVYKNSLQNEYGLLQALELKSLFLFNPTRNSGHGFGSLLFQRIDQIAKEMSAKIIYCTASSKVENSIKCAQKNGYKIARVLETDNQNTLFLMIKEI